MTAPANVSKGLPAERQNVYDVLRSALDVEVTRYGARPNTGYGPAGLVELNTLGSTGEPDMWELRLWVTFAGDPETAERRLDATLQAIDDALPATVTATEWTVAYDQDRKHWRAEGRSLAFR